MNTPIATITELAQAVRNIPDFPQPGIQFKDITPVLGDARLFASSVQHLVADFRPGDIDAVAGIDARGFIFAAAAALQLDAAFIPIRKKGKLPFRTLEQSYDLEYGSNSIAVHVDALKPGQRVLLVDDLLATGGTAAAATALLLRLQAQLVGVRFFIELGFLGGRSKLAGLPVKSLVLF